MSKLKNLVTRCCRLACVTLALTGIPMRMANAVSVWSHTGPDGWHTESYIGDDGEIKSIHIYTPDHVHMGSFYFTDEGTIWSGTNPNPEDGSSSGIDDDAIDILSAYLKLLGSEELQQEDIWTTLMLAGFKLDSLGPTVTDPFDSGALAEQSDEGFGGSISGFDPNVPWGEQIGGALRSGGSDDEEDDEATSYPVKSDPGSYGEYYGLDPSIINPVFIWFSVFQK